MSLTEKAAYLRGLYDGLGLKADTSAEARLMSAMIDVVEELASHVTESEGQISRLSEQVEDVSDALDELDELFADALEDEDEDEASDGEEYEDATEFEVECPKCSAPIVIDEATLEGGEVVCPGCGQRFSIDVGYTDEEDGADEEDTDGDGDSTGEEDGLLF